MVWVRVEDQPFQRIHTGAAREVGKCGGCAGHHLQLPQGLLELIGDFRLAFPHFPGDSSDGAFQAQPGKGADHHEVQRVRQPILQPAT